MRTTKENKPYQLIQMSFDGEYVRDSEHKTIEEAEETSADMGSKWYFYPFSVIVKGKTVKETGGNICTISTGEPVLSSLLKGKRFTTVRKLFKKVSAMEEAQGLDCLDFEDLLIQSI